MPHYYLLDEIERDLAIYVKYARLHGSKKALHEIVEDWIYINGLGTHIDKLKKHKLINRHKRIFEYFIESVKWMSDPKNEMINGLDEAIQMKRRREVATMINDISELSNKLKTAINKTVTI